MIGCAAEQEDAWDDVLSIRGVGNVLRLVGQVSDGRDSLCDVSLWAPLSWSIQHVADTQGKDKTAFPPWSLSLSMYLLLYIKASF